eukprot:4871731-Amphidinium_carterae.2
MSLAPSCVASACELINLTGVLGRICSVGVARHVMYVSDICCNGDSRTHRSEASERQCPCNLSISAGMPFNAKC